MNVIVRQAGQGNQIQTGLIFRVQSGHQTHKVQAGVSLTEGTSIGLYESDDALPPSLAHGGSNTNAP